LNTVDNFLKNLFFDIIRLFIRLMKDLQQISLKRFVQVNQKVEEVSKQLTGWQKAMRE